MMDFKNDKECYNYINNNTGDYKFIFINRYSTDNDEKYKIKKAPSTIPKFYLRM